MGDKLRVWENFSDDLFFSDLKFERELGKGSYGIVYQAFWRKAQVAGAFVMTIVFDNANSEVTTRRSDECK